jgi:hypothetical protein
MKIMLFLGALGVFLAQNIRVYAASDVDEAGSKQETRPTLFQDVNAMREHLANLYQQKQAALPLKVREFIQSGLRSLQKKHHLYQQNHTKLIEMMRIALALPYPSIQKDSNSTISSSHHFEHYQGQYNLDNTEASNSVGIMYQESKQGNDTIQTIVLNRKNDSTAQEADLIKGLTQDKQTVLINITVDDIKSAAERFNPADSTVSVQILSGDSQDPGLLARNLARSNGASTQVLVLRDDILPDADLDNEFILKLLDPTVTTYFNPYYGCEVVLPKIRVFIGEKWQKKLAMSKNRWFEENFEELNSKALFEDLDQVNGS